MKKIIMILSISFIFISSFNSIFAESEKIWIL